MIHANDAGELHLLSIPLFNMMSVYSNVIDENDASCMPCFFWYGDNVIHVLSDVIKC